MKNLDLLKLNDEDLSVIDGGGAVFAFVGGVIGAGVGSIVGGGKAVYDSVTGHGNEAGPDMFAAMKGCTVVGAIAGSFFAV